MIHNYLSGRRQVSKIGISISSSKPVRIGVPQGSHLGPVLLLLNINDLPKMSNLFSPSLFADDLRVCFKGSNANALVDTCNTDINILYNWAMIDSINYTKRLYMIHTKNRNIFISNGIMNNYF